MGLRVNFKLFNYYFAQISKIEYIFSVFYFLPFNINENAKKGLQNFKFIPVLLICHKMVTLGVNWHLALEIMIKSQPNCVLCLMSYGGRMEY